MPRLIDANALMDAIEVTDWYHISPKGYLQKGANSQIHTPLFKADDIFQALKDAPTVDAVEVVHGRWIPHYEIFDSDPSVGVSGGEYQTGWKCSVCGRYEPSEEPYCNCGAKMDGGNENG